MNKLKDLVKTISKFNHGSQIEMCRIYPRQSHDATQDWLEDLMTGARLAEDRIKKRPIMGVSEQFVVPTGIEPVSKV